MTNIEYKISTYPSKFAGYQSKSGMNGKVTMYISTIWNYSENFDDFVNYIVFIVILERICLERAFQKIRMKGRCNPCKLEKFAYFMFKNSIE